jgi:hypothetical protein
MTLGIFKSLTSKTLSSSQWESRASGSPVAKPQQHAHRKLPQPMLHSPDTVERPSSKQGRWATEGWNSPTRSTTLELNGGAGVAVLVWEVALKLKEAPAPTQRERGGWGGLAPMKR